MTASSFKIGFLYGTVVTLFISSSQASLSNSNEAHPVYNLTDYEYLVLEGGSLLPDPAAVAKVERELSLIRTQFPVVAEIKHNRKWIPGQVLTTRISQENISKLNSSSFGPLKHVEKIDVMPFFFVTVLSFNKPYSPPVLSDMLGMELGVPLTPNAVYYEYEVDNIGYRSVNSTYIFKKGTGMCKDNCSERYLWEFIIDESGNPKMLKEWSVPQNGERVVIY